MPMLLPEDFDPGDFYSDLYPKAHGTDKVISYTDAYDNLIESTSEQELRELRQERCQIRYDEM